LRCGCIGNQASIGGLSLPDDIRAACERVAEGAAWVRIVPEAIEPYARTLPAGSPPAPDLPGSDLETRAAFSVTLNAVNFGSGWFPTLRKPRGLSGFRTVEAALRTRGPWTADELAAVSVPEVAEAFGQDTDHPLVAHFTVALRELGHRVQEDYAASFLALALSGNGSAVALAEELASWPTWRDVSTYQDVLVPFAKRAQLAAGDLHLHGIAPAGDFAELTIFADNLVPHVLRLDGILQVDPELAARIERGELLEHGSPEEVELRACAVHAVELLVAANGSTTAAAADNVLWLRGGQLRYKAVPRHRARCTAY
jgi:hypothetical protein